MSFWSWLTGTDTSDSRLPTGVNPNPNPQGVPPASVAVPDYTPGDPDGFELLGDPIEVRAFPQIVPSGWDGWPATWDMPLWVQQQFSTLIDTAWACIDLNSQILASMPRYKLRGGQIVEPETWMENPDPRIYNSWHEFAHQLFWDYHLGEAFVLATDYFSNGWPMFFRVVPPAMVEIEMDGLERRYMIGKVDVTDSILHIRYKSTIADAHGIGPLDAAGARVIAAGVMQRYTTDIVRNGGINMQTLETDQELDAGTAQTVSDDWTAARRANVGRPPVLSAGIKLVDHQVSAKDMALLELSQFTDARICVLLGVTPFQMALPSGDSMTYSNVEQVFEYHDRVSIRNKADAVMSALSQWALPRGSSVELNRDEYSRPGLAERAAYYETLIRIGVLTAEDVKAIERIKAAGGLSGAAAIQGGTIQ